MNEYGSTIRLQHEYATRFFEEAMNPDMDELRQRDAFFANLELECPVRIEGSDLISEIPDIDIAALLGLKKEYIAVNEDSYEVSITEKNREKHGRLAYGTMTMVTIKIAA